MSRNPFRRPTLALGSLLAALLVTCATAHAAPGDLDATFDGDGRLIVSIGSTNAFGSSVANHAGDRIIAAGWAEDGGATVLAAMGIGGELGNLEGFLLVPVLDDAFARAVAVDGDGHVLLAGSASASGGQESVALVRILAGGGPDPAFGAGGIVLTAVGAIADAASAVAVDPGGRIVVAGRSRTPSGDDFLVARYLATGTLDTSFGGDGIVTLPIGSGDDVAFALAIDAGGRVVVAGATGSGSAADFALVRLDTHGDLDPTFGGDGIVTLPVGTNEDVAQAVAIDDRGRIVVAGYARSGSRWDFALARLDRAGALDPAFGSGGKTTTPIGPSDDRARGVAIDTSGRIVAAGSSRNASNDDFAVARYLGNGTLDPAFGAGGLVTTAFAAGDDTGRAMAIDESGRIVVAGSTWSGARNDVALARYDGGVKNDPPVATISVAPLECTVGDLVTLDGSGSSDEFDAPPGPIVSWDWDLDGDGFFDDCHTAICNVPCTSFAVGTATVRLIVQDNEGGTDVAAESFAVDGCSNGVLDPGERCDDGNRTNDDGCNETCGLDLRDRDIVVSLEGQPRILRIHPLTGAQEPITFGPPLVQPRGVAIDVFGDVYVADASATGTGAVIHVEVATGAQTVVASGGLLTGSLTDVAIEPSGQLLVTRGAATNTVVRVDPGSGAQTALSGGGFFSSAKSVVVSEAGDIFVLDDGADRVVRVHPVSGAQTLVSSGGLIGLPSGIGIEASGQLVASDRTTAGTGGVYRVDSTTGVQSAVSSGGLIASASGIDVDKLGSLVVVTAGAGSVVRVNATSGAQTLVSSGGLIGSLSDLDIRDIPVCGNGAVEGAEQCDDGNNTSGDCCSATCGFEVGAQPGCNDGIACTLDACDGNGTCAPNPIHTACNDGEVCSADVCTPFGCIYIPTNAGNVCRSASGACDVAETCNGVSTLCPANGFAPTTTTCRPSAGVCDVAESCTGSSPACPANGFAPTTTTCRAAASVCDAAESCTGSSAACPADAFAPSTTSCRASAGVCDVAESCTGSSPTCPANGFAPSTTTCRTSAGVCDVPETCTGSSAACPANAFASSATTCRASAGICDVTETCTGSSAACPADAFASSATTCRASAGICDVAETCSGSNAACPADGFASSATTCRASAGACDVAETCSGSSIACPADAFRPSSFVCRSATGECDQSESCSGSSSACPTDGFRAAGTACTPDSSACSSDICNGAGACTHPAANAGTVCRPAVGDCDVAEACDGVATTCPVDTGSADNDGDDICDAQDPCTNDGTADFKLTPKPKLMLSRVNTDNVPGNDMLVLQGMFDVAIDQSFSGVNPMVTGARLLLLNQVGGTVLDVTVPGGTYSGLGTRGWRTNGARTKWVYLDKTLDGSLSSTYGGISQFQILDKSRRTEPRLVMIKVRGIAGSYPVVTADSPVQAIVVLGAQPAGTAGLCGETAFTTGDCAFNASGNSLQCKK